GYPRIRLITDLGPLSERAIFFWNPFDQQASGWSSARSYWRRTATASGLGFSRSGRCVMYLPTATQRLVQVHFTDQLIAPVIDPLLLRRQQLTLGVEQRQVTVHAGAIAAFGNGIVVLARLQQVALGLHLFGIGFVGGQTIGHITEGILDRLFVLRHADIPGALGVVQVGLQAPGGEDRHADARREAPVAPATAEQVAQLATGGTRRAGQTDAREEGGAGRTYAGVGAEQLVLGSDNVRALEQQLRG